MTKIIIAIIGAIVLALLILWLIVFCSKVCKHEYKFHKVRAQHFDGPEAEDYLIEFFQCVKCGNIKNITVKDNLHVYKKR